MSIFNRDRLPCENFAECVTLYLEGRLPRRARKSFERHMAACPPCGAYLDQLRTTLAVTGRIEPDDIPDALRSELMHVFGEWRAARG